MKSPEEIKKGLEHCVKLTVCSDCPYSECRNCDDELFMDALAYIQQIEARINVLIPQAVLFEEAIAAGEKYKRERDAAVEQLKEVDRIDLFSCSHCKNEENSVCEFVDCENCDKDCPCATCVDMSNWKWRGAQEVE